MADNPVQLDSYDLAILSALSVSARLTTVELATMVFLSRTSVARRLDNLRRRGILIESGASICYEKLGFPMRALIDISISSHRVDKTIDELLARPEVLEAKAVSGQKSIILDVIARSMDQLHRFLAGNGIWEVI